MGGDEIFGGYRRHLSEKVLSLYNMIPEPFRHGIATPLIKRLPDGGSHPMVAAFRYAKKLVRGGALSPGRRYIGYCSWMSDEHKQAIYTQDVRTALRNVRSDERHANFLAQVTDSDPVNQMLYLDTMLYLPGHNLNYTDKMSMAASVEVRVPFLDNDVVDFAATLPPEMKIKRFTGKYILRQAMKDILPPDVLHRRKAGFTAPIRSWLGNELRDMVNTLLAPERLQARGIFAPHEVHQLINRHRNGQEDYSYQIWALLTLELWMQTFLDTVPHPVI